MPTGTIIDLHFGVWAVDAPEDVGFKILNQYYNREHAHNLHLNCEFDSTNWTAKTITNYPRNYAQPEIIELRDNSSNTFQLEAFKNYSLKIRNDNSRKNFIFSFYKRFKNWRLDNFEFLIFGKQEVKI